MRPKLPVIAALIGAVFGILATLAVGALPNNRPPGVAADHWISLSPEAGIVVDDGHRAVPGSAGLQGEFYFKRGETWSPVYLSPGPPRVRRATE